MSTSNDTSVQQRLQALRVLTGTLIGAIVVLAVVAVVVLGLDEYPSPVVAGALFVINVVAFGIAELVGYRTPALAPDTEPEAALHDGLNALQQTTIVRFAITEAPAILSLAWAFVAESGWVYLVGGFWALLSMAWHVWPSRRIAAKLERSLDREGARSGLTQVFGGTSGPGYQQY